MKFSRFHVVTDPFADDLSGSMSRMLYATRTAEVGVLDERLWDAASHGRVEELPREVVSELVAMELLVPDDEDELAIVLGRSADAVADDDDLYVVIQPTAACQLGCDYCGQTHRARQLSEQDQDLLVERIRGQLSAGRHRTLTVGWFGGEPLLAMAVLRRLTPLLAEVAAAVGARFRAKVVTNGLALVPDVLSELAGRLGVTSVEVTLDGPAVVHDERRAWKDGSPSFRRIVDNLVHGALRDDLDVAFTVRCNVDRENADDVDDLVEFLADAGLAGRIGFYVAPVYSWGNDAGQRSLRPQQFAEREIGWLGLQQRLGFNPSVLPGLRPVVCVAVQPASDVVDAFGNLFTCTEIPYVDSYGPSDGYLVGTLAQDSARGSDGRRRIPVVAEAHGARRLARFGDAVADGEVPCRSCPMLPVCGGGCPKQWFEGRSPCPPSKHNIVQKLTLYYELHSGGAQPATAGSS